MGMTGSCLCAADVLDGSDLSQVTRKSVSTANDSQCQNDLVRRNFFKEYCHREKDALIPGYVSRDTWRSVE